MSIFFESLDAIPEDERDNYVESEWDGKKGYQHKDVAKLAHAYKETKAKRDADRARLEELESKVSGFEEEKRKAAEEAEKKAYEKAKKEGNVEELEQRHQQQLEHERKTGYEEGYQAAKKEFSEQAAKQTAQSIANKLAAKLAVDEYSAEILQEQFVKSIQVDPESQEQVFLDSEGKATTWKLEDYEKQVINNPRFKRLIKADVVTNGGGMANGSNGSNAPRKPLKEMTDAERLEFKRRDPLGFQQAIRGK